MIAFIQKFFQELKEAKQKTDWVKGYHYAAGCLLREIKTPRELEEELYLFDSYDAGILSAIVDAIEKHLVEDDRL